MYLQKLSQEWHVYNDNDCVESKILVKDSVNVGVVGIVIVSGSFVFSFSIAIVDGGDLDGGSHKKHATPISASAKATNKNIPFHPYRM